MRIVVRHHQERRNLHTIQVTLTEVSELLDLMAKGVRKASATITLYHKQGRVQAEDPFDLAKDTLVTLFASQFELEARAGAPYVDRVSVNCRNKGKAVVEVEGNSEEWILGKLGIITRYLEARTRNTHRWFRVGLRTWLWICGLAIAAWLNYVFLGGQSGNDWTSSFEAALNPGRWLLIGLVFFWVGQWHTQQSLLQVRPVPIFKKDWVWSILVPIACSVAASFLFSAATKIVAR